MSPSEFEYRRQLIEILGSEESAHPEARAHSDGGDDGELRGLRLVRERTYAQVRALRGLARLAAPEDLAERVAHDLQLPEGRTQDRLLESLGDLPRLSAPAELDSRVLDPVFLGEAVFASTGERAEPTIADELKLFQRLEAPPVLERLVAEELADPQAARANRFAGQLRRKGTPRGLSRRIRAEANRAVSRAQNPSQPGARNLRRAWIPTVGLAAAAALVLWTQLRTPLAPEPDYGFEVRRVSSLDEMPPEAQALAIGMLGGLPQAVREGEGF